MDDGFLSVPKLAERWQVSLATVYRHLQSGTLRALKIGKVWRVREEDVREFERQALQRQAERRQELPG